MSSSTKLFNNISNIYGAIFELQVGYFDKIINRIKPQFDITRYESILDVGCGTGALSKLLSDKGLKVTGTDPSTGMLSQASKRLKN